MKKHFSLLQMAKGIENYEKQLRENVATIRNFEDKQPVLKLLKYFLNLRDFGQETRVKDESCEQKDRTQRMQQKLREIQHFRGDDMSVLNLRQTMIEIGVLRKEIAINMAKQKLRENKQKLKKTKDDIKFYQKGKFIINLISNAWS